MNLTPPPSLAEAPRRRLKLHALAALFLMFFGFGASLIISRHVFERLPHLEDEFAYLYQAKIFAGGRVWIDRGDDPAKYFWQPFLLQVKAPDGEYQRQFSKYPPGWSLVLMTGVWLGLPALINAFLAMLSVGLTYRLGREIFDPTTGLVAALLLAISPMALLINATLMSHTWAMSCVIGFTYAYWRTTRHGRGRFRWAILGGLMLGLLAATRPLTAVAMALPTAIHAFSRLYALSQKPNALNQTQPQGLPQPNLKAQLVVMFTFALATLPTTALYPLYNFITTGDARTNTYTLLWKYDTVGFGEGYGLNRGGHSLYYGWRNARRDLTEWFRDLYGFTLDKSIAGYMQVSFGWGAGAGLSWVPLLAGLFFGRRRSWVWFFFLYLVFIVGSGLLYWIGSVVNGAAAYSVRYYFEATFAVCLVSAYGITAWARALRRKPDESGGRLEKLWNRVYPVYFWLLVACAASLIGYTPARLREPLPPDWPDGLWRYNKAGMNQIAAIDALRGDQPAVILILNSKAPGFKDNWRDYAAPLAFTDPYLKSDIIVVRVYELDEMPSIVQRFLGRTVLYQIGEHLYRSLDEAKTQVNVP